MQASVMRIDEFISDRKTFVIPVYQRNYDWFKTNCEQLFNDVEFIAKNNGEHFIGTFVYKRESSASIFQEFIIIDGQQRITSIILFAKALYDLTDDEDLKDSIREKFIKHHNGTLKGKCKLRPTEYDQATFEKLMRDDLSTRVILANKRQFPLCIIIIDFFVTKFLRLKKRRKNFTPRYID